MEEKIVERNLELKAELWAKGYQVQEVGKKRAHLPI